MLPESNHIAIPL